MMDDQSKISVVAVTPVFNRQELTLQCLQSLFDGDLARIDLHAIVVDDGSTDGSGAAIAARFPQVQIISGDGTLWYSEGTNVGVREALKRNPAYILIYNNDSIFAPDCLARLVACAEAYPTTVVGAALVKWDDRDTIFQVGTRWQTSYGGWRTIGPQTLADLPEWPFPVETLAGNCILVPAAAFRDAGLMKSDVLPNFGDSELAARMRRRGWRLVVEPAARVLCEPNAAPKRMSSMRPRELYDALWRRRTSYHNLKQRHAANIGGAPRRWQAYAATAIYVARLAMRLARLGGSWPNNWPERPLKETARLLMPVDAPARGNGRTIVYAWPYTEWGGIQVYMLQLMKAAKAAGYDVAAAVPGAIPKLQLDMIRAETDLLWLFDAARDNGEARSLRERIARRSRNRRADDALFDTIATQAPADAIIHVDAGPWSSSRLLGRLLERHHVVMTVHTGLQRLAGRSFDAWRRGFRAVMGNPRFHLIAANGEARRSLSPYVEPDALDHVPVSQTSFDPDRIDEAMRLSRQRSVRQALGLGPSDFRLVVGAQFVERKGYRDLLDALRRLRERGVRVDCLWLAPVLPPPEIAGVLREPAFDGLVDLRQQSDVGTGHADYLAAVAELADIFVLPSHLEGLPLAIVEAMALGLPCIATGINAVPEAVVDGLTGILVPPRDPQRLAGAIERLATDPDLRRAMGEAGRRRAFERHALPRAVLPTLATYAAARDS